MHLSVVRPEHPDQVRGPLREALAARSALGVLAPTQDADVLVPDQPAVAGTVVLTTSGSTGGAKAVALSHTALIASAEATRDRLGEPTDWMCALPVHHIAGLMTVVRAQVSGTSVVAVSPRLTDLPRPRRPSALSLVPTQLVRAMGQPELVAVLRGYSAVLVGGAASDPAVVERARAAGIAVITTYGMTETCGGCVYDGAPLPGVEIEVDADQRILLGGPMVFSEYRGDLELTAQVLVNGRVRTQDRGFVEGGRLEVLGRLDDVVISGGVNVDLAEVERAVTRVDAETVVVGVPDPEWGVVITLVTTTTHDLQWWHQRLSATLGSAAVPRRLQVVDSLPVTRSGKVDRQRLLTDLAAQGSTASPAPRPAVPARPAGPDQPDVPDHPAVPVRKETRGNAG